MVEKSIHVFSLTMSGNFKRLKYKKCGVKDAIKGTSFITQATLFGNFMI